VEYAASHSMEIRHFLDERLRRTDTRLNGNRRLLADLIPEAALDSLDNSSGATLLVVVTNLQYESQHLRSRQKDGSSLGLSPLGDRSWL